jgi:hypothetical protein
MPTINPEQRNKTMTIHIPNLVIYTVVPAVALGCIFQAARIAAVWWLFPGLRR